uniref:X8 domain-containing protein n=1 Tax=Salix viminalis TaxID=40686 RepID=A0A6N2NE60_SALVM
MAVLVFLVLFLALTGHSSATYCVCKDGVGDAQLQKSLDYACGAGADCAQVLQNGPCYQPNTIKDHCSYAVNSYFQKKGQATGSCDFSGTAMTSATPPQSKLIPQSTHL